MRRHSRLSGSQDLELWAKSGGDSVQEAYKEHLMGPIIAVKDELFKTFRQARPDFLSAFQCMLSLVPFSIRHKLLPIAFSAQHLNCMLSQSNCMASLKPPASAVCCEPTSVALDSFQGFEQNSTNKG